VTFFETIYLYTIHIPYQRVNDIINGRRGVTPSTALRLAKFFGMSPDFLMNVQMRWEMYFARKEEASASENIEQLKTPLVKAPNP